MVDLIVDGHVPRPHPGKHDGDLDGLDTKACFRQRDPVAFPPKLSIPPAANVSTPSPSPLTASLTEQYYDAEEYFLAPASPDEDGDVFYDWYEEPSEHKRVSAAVEQIPEPEYDGAAKGRIDRKQNSRNTASAPSFSPASPFPPASPFSPTPLAPSSGFTFARGPAKTTVNLAPGHVAINPVAEEARKFVSQDSCFPRKPVKKALAVGINYMTWDKDKRLYYAVNDAKLWRDTFVGKGVEPENIKIVTDDGGMRDAPTFDTLLGHIRWLVRGATAGDSLFFVFSGHAILTQNYGPSILTADKRIFPRPILEKELVMSVAARQGVVTKAMCAAFERISTRRDLWSYLVQEIETENNKRTKRDANKSVGERPLPSSRIQHAELWVSQAHLLPTQPSATPVLDQPIL
ncbi:hypothetical protein RSAG8_08325, partial [Rhizoctonia solani AG-8 WAC10335]